MARIYGAITEIDAGVAISLLQANGFHPEELKKSLHILRGGADQYYFVEVPDEEADAARELLIDHDLKSGVTYNS